jgi:hypothetical protein
MVNSTFFYTPSLLIPSELSSRDHLFSYEVGILLSISFLLIAFARLARPNIYAAVSIGMIKTSGLRTHIRETFPLNKRGSILLLVNYLLSTTLVLYLFMDQFQINRLDQLVIAGAAPLVLLVGNIACLRVTGWITGEYNRLKEPVIMKILGAQVLGILYFLCALVWVLNSSYQDVLTQVIIWTFIIESSLRVIKGVTTVYNNGVSWYYIILYFCTLEILPLFVVYYFVLQNFVD